MFTGIIEEIGTIQKVTINGTNLTFQIESKLAAQLHPDESVSHNGICLTIEAAGPEFYNVTAIEETLLKSNASFWETGTVINLERPLKMNGRLDGHIVQGHVDGMATCTEKVDKNGSTEYTFQIDAAFASLIIEKGSVCVNGVSLTAFNVLEQSFAVAIIPYTFAHTNFPQIGENSIVNIEYDILGKYVQRMLELRK